MEPTTNDQYISLIQYTIAATTGEGCSVEDAEQIKHEWQRIR